MSKFKAGDRVLVTNPRDDFCERPESCAGMTGEVTHIWGESCEVRLSEPVGKYREWGFEVSELSGVTDFQPDTTTLTRRDHFAMAALTGLLAKYGNDAGYDIHRDAYSHADAMEAARNKEGAE